MSRDTIQVVASYGSLKPYMDYEVIERGYDWVKVKCRGSALFVPDSLVGRAPRPRYYEEPQDEEEFYG